ncbi:ORF1 [Duck adenovirus 3]|uniref:dUTP diphosphatase n=3 Tax=Duck aviadenovirus B TaxID=1534553 RepID=A0A5F2P0B0_9ADEN|nr:dUTPase [Duck adenovirus 2]AYH52255.1 ORF1 [Duck adenovirus 3]QKW89974.1 ORF1 [Duck aviadenovirus B]AIE77208.1 ORF1 [Duck adenovirus 2]ALF39429.1 ORF1 [Duck adenovirus 2]AYH52281.1 ORF1 [Duck adenovirus 3]
MSSQQAFLDEVLQVKLLTPYAYLPTKGTPNSIGYDLYSSQTVSIDPFTSKVVSTDISIVLPRGCYGRIAPRSGLAAKYSIDVGAGVIDPDYRGSISVVLFNHSDVPFHVSRGDRIAQLICERAATPILVEVADIDNNTARGTRGFGSTGWTTDE